MNPIPAWAVSALMALGRGQAPAHQLRLLEPCDELNRLHWRNWNFVADSLDEDELFALLRGAVLAEEHYRWLGGSVAAGVWLGQRMLRRFPHRWADVHAWLNENSTNSYILSKRRPQGHRSKRSFVRYNIQEARRHASHDQRQREQQAAAKERRALERQQASARRVAVRARQRQNTAQRGQVLGPLAQLAPLARLQHCVQDRSVSLAYYPVSWGQLPLALLAQLGCPSLTVLVERSQRRSAGPWRQHRRLFRSAQQMACASALGEGEPC